MAGNNGDELAQDVAALGPDVRPTGWWTIYKRDARNLAELDAQGERIVAARYPVLNFMDVPTHACLHLLAMDEMVRSKPAAEIIEALRDRTRVLAPTMPEDVIMGMTPRELLQLGDVAMKPVGEAETANPPEPGSASS